MVRSIIPILSILIMSIAIILGDLIMVDAGINLTPTTYISYVDESYGFYKIRNLEQPPRPFTYESHTININQGDTIIWQNDAEKTTFTILSDQNLWDRNVGYLRSGSKINYKFNSPGKYTVYIKEYPSRRQTIIVGAEWTITTISPTVTISHTPIPTTAIINDPVPITVTPSPISGPNVSTINMPKTMIASIVVAILSILITFRAGRNR